MKRKLKPNQIKQFRQYMVEFITNEIEAEPKNWVTQTRTINELREDPTFWAKTIVRASTLRGLINRLNLAPANQSPYPARDSRILKELGFDPRTGRPYSLTIEHTPGTEIKVEVYGFGCSKDGAKVKAKLLSHISSQSNGRGPGYALVFHPTDKQGCGCIAVAEVKTTDNKLSYHQPADGNGFWANLNPKHARLLNQLLTAQD